MVNRLQHSSVDSILYLQKLELAPLSRLRRWRWQPISFEKVEVASPFISLRRVEVASPSHPRRWRCHPHIT